MNDLTHHFSEPDPTVAANQPREKHDDSEVSSLTERIARRASTLGLDLFGVCAAAPVDGWDAYRAWSVEGMAGEMEYLVRDPLKRSDPRRLMPGCRSVIVAGMIYHSPAPHEKEGDDGAKDDGAKDDGAKDDGAKEDPQPGDPYPTHPGYPVGSVARYARGDDYHEVLKERLVRLLEAVQEEADTPVGGRVYVDTGPLLERDLAYAAGLGWRAKNACLIHPRLGSYFFLGEILVDLDLAAAEKQPLRCGSCHRCLDACPTQAFIGPGILDARRCISYLTIELRGPIPRELRPLIGSMVFGCDICQDVCPWNSRAAVSTDPAFRARPGVHPIDLTRLLQMTQTEFSTLFRGSAIKRAKRRGLARNAAVAMGNSGDRAAVPALCEALAHDEPLVRGHVAWALGRLGGDAARSALVDRRQEESDPWVLEEIALALEAQPDPSGI